MSAAASADDILLASTGYVNEPLNHSRKDSIIDFSRVKVLLRIGANDYTVDVLVAHKSNDALLLYVFVKLKKAKHTLQGEAYASPIQCGCGRYQFPAHC